MNFGKCRNGQIALWTMALACGGPAGETTGSDSDGATTSATGTTAAEATGTSEATDATTAADPTTGVDPTTGAEPTTVAEPTTGEGVETDTSEGGTSTGAPVVGCADLPLCDDFESATPGEPPDPARWMVVSPNCSGTGTLAVSGEAAHSGANSVRIDGGGGYCDHVFFAHAAGIAGIGDVLWVRFYVRFEDALGDGHVTFATLDDQADGGKALRMGGQAKILMWNRESDDATLPALSPAGISTSVAPAPGQWSCVEFMIDGAAGALQTFVDGAEVEGLRVDGEPTPDIDQQWLQKAGWKPDVTDLKLGWESYAGQTMVLYIDDVAAASERVGCD